MNPPADQYSWSLISGENYRQAGLVAVLLAIPFVIARIAHGSGVADLFCAGVLALFLLDFASLGYRGRSLLNRAFLLALAGVSLCWLMIDSGAITRLLAVPLIFGLHFMLERRPAMALNLLLLAGLLPSLLLAPYSGEAVPVAAALLLSGVVAWSFATTVRRQLRTLDEQVATDALTGAYNRRRLNARLAEEAQRRKRHGHAVSLIIFDVDHFKRINDQYGHDVGDRVLRILVDTVKARVRLTDEVFRFGGEEFVILLPDTPIEPALKLAQDITDMIAAVRLIEGGPVSISCGVGELKANEEAADWVRRCDLALYESKHRGRGRVYRATDELSAAEPDRVLELDPPASSRAG